MGNSELQSVLDRLNRLEERVTRLEGGDSGKLLKVREQPALVRPEPLLSGADRDEVPLEQVNTANAERVSTGRMLGFTAGFCFFLATAFIIKLAIDSAWLTPERQLLLAALAGFVLIGAGFALRKRDLEYAGILPGIGIVVLYLTIYGGNIYYSLPDDRGLIVFSSAVSLFSIYLLRYFARSLFVYAAVIGTYLVPFVAYRELGLTLPAVFYFLASSLTLAILSLASQNRLLQLLSAYSGILAFGLFGEITEPRGAGTLLERRFTELAIFQFAQFVISLCGVAAFSIKYQSPLKRREAWGYFPLLLFFYAIEYEYLTHINRNLAPWVALALALTVIIVFQATKRKLPASLIQSGDVVYAFVAVVLFHAGYLNLLPEKFNPLLLIVLAGVLTFYRDFPLVQALRENFVVAALFYIIVALELPRACLENCREFSWYWVSIGIVYAGAALAFHLWTRRLAKDRDRSYFVLAVGHIQAMCSLYALSSESGSFVVSLVWGIYAFAILGIASRTRDASLGRSSTFVLAVVAGKVLLYDVALASALVRIGCLILTGVLLYAGGFLLRRMNSWE